MAQQKKAVKNKKKVKETSRIESGYASMREVNQSDYQDYLKKHKEVLIEDTKIPLGETKKIKVFEPKEFDLECTSVWSFPKRGDWATHKGDYRGNWAPEIPRNIILRYSKPDDTVLDQMMGGGTTLIECKLLNRNAIGLDINPAAVMLTRDRLNFIHPNEDGTTQKTYLGDARNLDGIEKESIDLIATHPPYANIISYSKDQIDGDLSQVGSISQFDWEIKKIAKESFRVLRPGKYCAILIGDTRKNKHYVPITPLVMNSFLEAGFLLKEDIIKRQWQCKTTSFWSRKSKDYNFLLIMHEHLYIFRKPEEGENINKFRY